MADEIQDISEVELARLMAGEPRVLTRLAAGARIRAKSPLRYPGRRGPVVVYLTPRGAKESDTSLGEAPGALPDESATSTGATGGAAAASTPVRISDGGDLIKSLDEQGMDLSVDMILSKTVFHAVKETDGGAVTGGEICLDSTVGKVPADLWRFLQLVAEIIGLRHSKYKDALLRLSRRQDAPDLLHWNDQT
jgi:hypothetical protein